ncbi:MAG TPA: hypothetical protein VGM22_23480 [Methylomirabilota bacterium]|jgi:hypothetical protein
MTTYKTFAAAASAVLLTLVTAGTMPALAASQDDQQAPRGQMQATLGDQQAPRGDVRATLGDQQAPRGDVRASITDIQAPRGQDTQAPATNDDVQAPRSARF